MRRINKSIFLILLVILGCTKTKTSFSDSGNAPDHSSWTVLLQKHVRSNGLVDYKGFVSDKDKLDAYASLLSANPPAQSWSDSDQIAYWINAYNAFTIKLIVDNYPVKSIKDLNPTISIPTLRSIWTKEWFQIGGEDFSLDRIEHKILRKEFEEPRIHFAVNCASISCPVLRAEAYEGEKLDAQLTEQTQIFLADKSRNNISTLSVEVSKIFSWFGGDFKKNQTLIQFLNKYSAIPIDEDAKISYMTYDWNLNDIEQLVECKNNFRPLFQSVAFLFLNLL